MKPASFFLILFTFLSSTITYGQGVKFNENFAPQEGLIKEPEKPLRDEICLNGKWLFMPVELNKGISFDELKNPPQPGNGQWEKIPVKIPSPWNVNGFTNGEGGDFRSFPSYPESWNNVKSAWLKKIIRVPDHWSESRIILHFEAVAGYTKVFVNGNEAGEHFDTFLPFSIDVTDLVKPGEDMEILVWVAHGSLTEERGKYGKRHHIAGSFWGNYIAGIWQDVYLQKYPPLYITDTYVKPWVDKDELEIEVRILNTREKPVKFDLSADIKPWINLNGKSVMQIPEVNWKLGENVLDIQKKKLEIGPHEEKVFTFSASINNRLDLWSPESPNLYGLVLSIKEKKNSIDTDYTRFGWRQFKIEGTQLLLNGNPIRMKSDSWHFMGVPQMTRRYAYAWFQMLLDANANSARLHAQVFPRFYLEMADELGICILSESAIWSSDGGPKIDSDRFWEASKKHVKGLILRDRNHPSVFGWSVCNETLPVTKYVFNAPPEIIARNVGEINSWVKIAKETDPTRDWISGDGETMEETDLPTIIGHYGGEKELEKWSSQGKPWGIGETGMAYYGTPAQVAKINGDRAYESQLGRMEGLAGEAFDLISRQRNKNAAYSSIFNIVWYGLKPLPLGLENNTRPPEITDGIFFSEFKEGKPGYQPERLGPYTSTLNPGYDPSLPLYDPWPLFFGVKKAFSDQYQSLENPWDKIESNEVKVARSAEKQGVVWLAGNKSNVKDAFERMSVVFESLKPGERQLIILDGQNPPPDDTRLINDLQTAMRNGSCLFIWNATEKTKSLIEKLSGEEISFFDRSASSYIIKKDHPLLNGLSNASLYFTELSKNPVSVKTMGGDWVEESSVILEACGTDWRTWNYQPENVKTAKVYRNEMESKPPGNVIVKEDFCEGELIVSTLDILSLGQQSRFLIRNMLNNMGVKIPDEMEVLPSAINEKGILKNVNFYGSVKNDSREIELVFDYGPMDDKDFMTVKPGTLTKGMYWDVLSADENGVFDFLQQDMKQKKYAAVYLSFWMYSPRSLTDLLVEPDMPRVDMHFGVTDALAFNINGNPVKSYLREGEYIEDEFTYLGLPLEKGWNHVLIKVGQATGEWKCKIRFSSTVPDFLKSMDSALYR